MQKTKFELVKTEKVESIICNKCEALCSDPREFTGISIRFFGGYYSKFFEDLNHYSYDLCEQCHKELVDSFKIKVEIKEYIKY